MFLQYTEVPVVRSAMEITKEISKRGATQVRQTYDDDGRLIGMAFLVRFPDGREYPISLPCRIDRMKDALYQGLGPQQKKTWTASGKLEVRAFRIAWRQLAIWVKAQFALIDLDMTCSAEVFLPYVETDSGARFFESLEQKQFRALGPGKTPEEEPEDG